MKNKKWLKIRKIGIVACCVFAFLCTTASALVVGDVNGATYVAPLRFDVSVNGAIAELTPSIVYKDGNTISQSVEECSNVTLFRNNWSATTKSNTVENIEYMLKFNTTEAVDTFTLTITAPLGIYNYVKYDVPLISLPLGYEADLTVYYHERYTQTQTFTDDVSHYVQYHTTHTGTLNDVIALMRDTAIYDNVSYDILGDVVIDDYTATLVFTKVDTDESKFGDPGYYQFDEFITYQQELFLQQIGYANGYAYVELSDVTIQTYDVDENIYTEQSVHYIIFGDPWDLYNRPLDIFYGFEDTEIMVYDYEEDKWYGFFDIDENTGFDATPLQVRTLYFRDYLENSIMYPYGSDVGQNSNFNEEYFLSGFVDFLEYNTIYSVTNPLEVTTLDIRSTPTSGAYVHYSADRMLDTQASHAYTSLYTFGKSHGLSQGGSLIGSSLTDWIGNAVRGVMNVELFPNFSLGGLLGIVFGLLLTVAFLKVFAGG